MHTRWLVICSVLLPIVATLGCSESFEKSSVATRPEVTPVTQWVENPCGVTLTVPFLAGQHISVGSVTVANDEGQLCVEIQLEGGWVLEETHVAIALSPEEIPQTGSGNPQVGKFAFSAEHNPPVTAFDHCLDLATYGYVPGTPLYIAVHAAVALLDAGGQTIQTETAWAEGDPFPGSSWAMFFGYTVQECFPEPPGDAVTLTFPNGGQMFSCGEPVTITWEIQGEGPSAFLVELLHDGAVCETLNPVDEYGELQYVYGTEFDWAAQPCGEATSGTGYTIRVRDPFCLVEDDSDEAFAFDLSTCFE